MGAVIRFPSFIVPATGGKIFTAYKHEEMKKRINIDTANKIVPTQALLK